MPLVSLCKSCSTVSYSIIERCKYCGSTRIEMKNIEGHLIQRIMGRMQYVREDKRKKKDNANPETSTQT